MWIKKILSALMAIICLCTVLCTSAFATGVMVQRYPMSGSTPYYRCQYTVDGNLHLSGHGMNAGAMENNSFYVTENGTYKIEFTTSNDCGATVNFWKAGTHNPNNSAYQTIIVPKRTSGMPETLNYMQA